MERGIVGMFRFLTPLLIAVVGWFSLQYLGSIDSHFGKIDAKFETFLESYRVMDKRVDKLEYRVFNEKGEKYE